MVITILTLLMTLSGSVTIRTWKNLSVSTEIREGEILKTTTKETVFRVSLNEKKKVGEHRRSVNKKSFTSDPVDNEWLVLYGSYSVITPIIIGNGDTNISVLPSGSSWTTNKSTNLSAASVQMNGARKVGSSFILSEPDVWQFIKVVGRETVNSEARYYGGIMKREDVIVRNSKEIQTVEKKNCGIKWLVFCFLLERNPLKYVGEGIRCYDDKRNTTRLLVWGILAVLQDYRSGVES